MKLLRTTIKIKKNIFGLKSIKIHRSAIEAIDKGDIIDLKDEGFIKKEDLHMVKNEGDLFFFYDVIS